MKLVIKNCVLFANMGIRIYPNGDVDFNGLNYLFKDNIMENKFVCRTPEDNLYVGSKYAC